MQQVTCGRQLRDTNWALVVFRVIWASNTLFLLLAMFLPLQKRALQDRKHLRAGPWPVGHQLLPEELPLAVAVPGQVVHHTSDVTGLPFSHRDDVITLVTVDSSRKQRTDLVQTSRPAGSRTPELSPAEFFRPRHQGWLQQRDDQVEVAHPELVHHHHQPSLSLWTGTRPCYRSGQVRLVSMSYSSKQVL